ncbi:MAG: restriction endonuclease [bacterium]|nr:restriction endonuclease [bacterium]
MNKSIQVFEHQAITIYPNKDGFALSKNQLDKLLAFNDQNENKYFTGIRDGVKFNQYVGVIQIGGQTIEILPKADKGNDYDKWRKVLLKMLAVCKKVSMETVSDANLSKRQNTLLDLYFERYIFEVQKLVHQGLVKKYRLKSGNVSALKGQLKFAQNIQFNLVHQEQFYTQHQTYDHEHLINQILLKALRILSQIVNSPSLKSNVQSLLLNFTEIKEITITPSHFNQLKLNRKTARYKEALQIAKMIILNYSPDIKGGQENMIAILFDMNKLWEEYIYRMLLKAGKEEYEITDQMSKPFWESKTIRPDIVLKHFESNKSFIIDTKWKVINNDEPSDDDLKQMYAYNQYWEADRSILLYPQIGTFNENFGKFHVGSVNGHHCKLGFINVLDENGSLDLNIGSVILEKLEIDKVLQ